MFRAGYKEGSYDIVCLTLQQMTLSFPCFVELLGTWPRPPTTTV